MTTVKCDTLILSITFLLTLKTVKQREEQAIKYSPCTKCIAAPEVL